MTEIRAEDQDRYLPGDVFTYTSVTQGYRVVWTRGEDGTWSANDGRIGATDDEVTANLGEGAELIRRPRVAEPQ